MRSATELLAEMLAIYNDPELSRGKLLLWLHQHQGEIREVVEKGDDSARLDWLEASADEMIELNGNHKQLCWGEFYPEVENDPKTLRAAIDRARGEGE